jgi:hypothetical protein
MRPLIVVLLLIYASWKRGGAMAFPAATTDIPISSNTQLSSMLAGID